MINIIKFFIIEMPIQYTYNEVGFQHIQRNYSASDGIKINLYFHYVIFIIKSITKNILS